MHSGIFGFLKPHAIRFHGIQKGKSRVLIYKKIGDLTVFAPVRSCR